MSVKAWRQFTPFYFYTSVVLCLGTAAALGEEASRGGIFLLFVSGFLSWGLIEYGLHRFVFHHDSQSELGRKFVQAAHLAHHETPNATDQLFASLRMSVPLAASYWLLAWVFLGWRLASYLFVGLIAGYFCYEWLHFQAHHGRPRLRLLRYLKKYHLLHHHRTNGQRFGVTSPLFDLVFGTFKGVSDTSPQPDRRFNRS